MASLAGKIELGVGPSTKGFWDKVRVGLKSEGRAPEVDVPINPGFKKADAELAAWRQRQEKNALNIPVSVDENSARSSIRRIESVFKQSSLSKAIRLQVVVAGAAALPLLAQGALSAATAITELGQATLLLPGLFSGLAATVGTLLTGLTGLSAAFKASNDGAQKGAQFSREYERASRDLEKAQRGIVQALKDANREIQDQHDKLTQGQLSVEQAQINVTKANERLAQGGFKTYSEWQQAILDTKTASFDLGQAIKQHGRDIQDAGDNAGKTATQTNTFKDALDRLSDSADNFAKAQKQALGFSEQFLSAMANLSPAGREFVNQILSIKGAWKDLAGAVQGTLLQGLGQQIVDLSNRHLPALRQGMQQVAQGLNTDLKQIFSSLGSDKNASAISQIFHNVGTALTRAAPGLNSFVNAFVKLSSVGGTFLPRLADAFNKVMGRFEAFVNRAAEDGSLERWIDRGLAVISSLGNALGSIVSIFSSVTQAYETATGNIGGFATTAEKGLGKLAAYLASPKGQNTLVQYLKQAHDFLGKIKDSLPGIIDAFQAFSETARAFATVIFPVFSFLGKQLQQHIGLTKILLGLYFSFRTAKPILEELGKVWGRATVSADNHKKKVLELKSAQATLLEQGPALDSAQRLQAQSSRAFSDALSRGQGATANAARAQAHYNDVLADHGPKAQKTKDAAAQLNIARYRETEALSNVTTRMGQYNDLSEEVRRRTLLVNDATARLGGSGGFGGLARKIGSKGASIAGTLVGALGGLAATIGTVGATAGLLFALDRLSENQRKAGDAAEYHRSREAALRQELDQTTGAVTEAAKGQDIREAQKFKVRGDNNNQIDVDALAASAKLGIDKQTFGQSFDPTQIDSINKVQQAADQNTLAAVQAGNDQQFNRFAPELAKHGVSAEVYAKALNGDPDSITRFEAASKAIRSEKTVLGVPPPNDAVPNLGRGTENLLKAGVPGVSVGQFERSTLEAHRAGGDAAKAAGTPATLNPGNPFAAYGPQNVFMSADKESVSFDIDHVPPDKAALLKNGDPNNPNSESFQLTTDNLATGRYTVTLTGDQLHKFVQGFAGGGKVWGAGDATSDSIPAMLSNGEFVLNAKAAQHYGADTLYAMNDMRMPKRFNGGGMAPTANPNWEQPVPKFPGQPGDRRWWLENPWGGRIPPPVGSAPGPSPSITIPGFLTPGLGGGPGSKDSGRSKAHSPVHFDGGGLAGNDPPPFKIKPYWFNPLTWLGGTKPADGPVGIPRGPAPQPSGVGQRLGQTSLGPVPAITDPKTLTSNLPGISGGAPSTLFDAVGPVKPVVAPTPTTKSPTVKDYFSGAVSQITGIGAIHPALKGRTNLVADAGRALFGDITGIPVGLPGQGASGIPNLGGSNGPNRALIGKRGKGPQRAPGEFPPATPGRPGFVPGVGFVDSDGKPTGYNPGAPKPITHAPGGSFQPGPGGPTAAPGIPGVATPPKSIISQLPAATTAAPLQPGQIPTYEQLGLPATGSSGPYIPNLSGSGALPDTKSTAASAVANAPINPNANIIDFLRQEGQAYGLKIGAGTPDANLNQQLGVGTHDDDGAQHSVHRALDIGSGDEAQQGKISQFVKDWMADPTKVASTRQLIFRGPDGDYGIINGRVLQGAELQSVYGGDLGNHTDHVHLALEGVPTDVFGPDGQGGPLGGPGSANYVPQIGGPTPGVPGTVPVGIPGIPGPIVGQIPNNIPGLTAPIQGPNGPVPFSGANLLQSIGQILLQAVLGFFGIDISSITGPLSSIFGAAAGQPGQQQATDESYHGPDQTVVQQLVQQAADAKAAGDEAGARALLDAANNYASGGQSALGGGGANVSSSLATLTPQSNQNDIGKAILSEAIARGYSRDQAVAILSAATQESGLSPFASGGGGAWHGIFQQDGGYPGRDDPKQNIAAFFDRLGSHGGPTGDIWKNIFWLQQRPGEASAESAFANGRQAYLNEIQSKLGPAQAMAAALGFSGGGPVRHFDQGGPANKNHIDPVMIAALGSQVGYLLTMYGLGMSGHGIGNEDRPMWHARGGLIGRYNGGGDVVWPHPIGPSTLEGVLSHGLAGGQWFSPWRDIAALYPSHAAQNNARGGAIHGPGGPTDDKIPAYLSNGEFVMKAAAVDHYGMGAMVAMNNMRMPHLADGGSPLGWLNPNPTNEVTGPLPLPPPGQYGQIDPSKPMQPNQPGVGGGVLPMAQLAQAAGESVGAYLAPKFAGDIGGGWTGTPTTGGEQDPRSVLGAPPATTEHLNPALKAGIEGAFSTVGSLAATGATLGINAVAPGAGGAAGAGIQAGAQLAGQLASGLANVGASFLVGSVTPGTTGQGYGAPLLPQRQTQGGGNSYTSIHQGDINAYSPDQAFALKDRKEKQAALPFLNRVG